MRMMNKRNGKCVTSSQKLFELSTQNTHKKNENYPVFFIIKHKENMKIIKKKFSMQTKKTMIIKC